MYTKGEHGVNMINPLYVLWRYQILFVNIREKFNLIFNVIFGSVKKLDAKMNLKHLGAETLFLKICFSKPKL